MTRKYNWKVYNLKNTYFLRELQNSKYGYIDDDNIDDLKSFIDWIPPHKGIVKKDITGIIYELIDGEINELYFTYESRPYDLGSYYYKAI